MWERLTSQTIDVQINPRPGVHARYARSWRPHQVGAIIVYGCSSMGSPRDLPVRRLAGRSQRHPDGGHGSAGTAATIARSRLS